MMQAQLAHVTRSIECEHAVKAAGRAQASLDEVKVQLEEHLESLYRDNAEQKEMVNTSVQLDLEVSGLEGALSVLSQYISHLQSSQSEKRKALEVLADKKKRIQQFTSTAESNQVEIQDLVQHNSSLKGKLQKQRTELSLYIRDNVCGLEVEVISDTRSLLDSVCVEVQLFSGVSLAMTTRTPQLNRSCDMSIHCLHLHQPSGYPNWQELVSVLGIKPYSSPERILQSIVDLLRKVEQLTRETDKCEREVADMKLLSANNTQAKGVLLACQRYDRQLREKGISTIKHCLSQASLGLAQCSQVEQTMNEWWEQPAQYCVPWVTCDGMSCDKWVEQWRVLTAKLRQLSAKQKC